MKSQILIFAILILPFSKQSKDLINMFWCFNMDRLFFLNFGQYVANYVDIYSEYMNASKYLYYIHDVYC